MKKNILKPIRILSVGGMIALSLVLYACGGGGSSSSGAASAGSTVQGNVATVTAELQRHEHAAPGQNRLAQAVLDMLASPAYAQSGLGGITVTIAGRTAATDSSGKFIVGNVPAGKQTLTFQSNGTTASLPLNVPPQSVVEVENVVIAGGKATPESVKSSSRSGSDDDASNDDIDGDDDLYDDEDDDTDDDNSTDDDGDDTDDDDDADDDDGDDNDTDDDDGDNS